MEFRLLLKIWVKILVSENVSSKCSQKLLDYNNQSATDTFKTVSKRAIEKTAEATDDLIGNKITNKITKVTKSSPQNNSEVVTNEHDKELPKGSYISPEKRQKIIDELTLRF